MNSRNSRPRVPWSHGDKFLMLVLGLVLPLALGLVLWLRALDQNPTVSVPMPTMPVMNARNYYIAAYNAVVDNGKIEDARSPQYAVGRSPNGLLVYTLADKEKLVAENVGAIQTLHTGFKYPYQEPPARSFNAAFLSYTKFRAFARFLSLQAQVDAEKGDIGGTMGAGLDAVQMGETMPRGGPLIGMLVGVACQAIGRKQAWAAANRLNATQARAATRRLEAIRTAHVPFADTLQEEEWSGQASLLELMRKHNWPADMLSAMTSDQQGSATASTWITATRLRLTGKRTVMAEYTQYMDRSIANARQPYAAHPPCPAFAD